MLKLYSARVIDSNGKKHVISEESISKDLFEDSIKNRGYFIIDVKEASLKNSIFLTKKLNKKFLNDFSFNIYTLLDFGIDINEIFKILSEIYISGSESELIQYVITELKKGEKLSNALQKSSYSYLFDDFFIMMISSGEQSGNLKDAFSLVNKYLKNNEKIKEKIISSSIYPIVLIILGIFAVHLLFFLVLPTFNSMFVNLDIKPPLLIRIMTSISNFLINNVFLYIIFVILLIISIITFFRTKLSTSLINFISFKFPIISRVIKLQLKIKISFSLEIFIKSGAKLEEALIKLNEIEKNPEIKKQYFKTLTSLKEGGSVKESFKNIKIFEPRDLNIIEISDSISKTDEGFKKIYEDTDYILDNYFDKILKLIEPVIMIFIGLFMAFIMYLVMSPTFASMQQISNY